MSLHRASFQLAISRLVTSLFLCFCWTLRQPWRQAEACYARARCCLGGSPARSTLMHATKFPSFRHIENGCRLAPAPPPSVSPASTWCAVLFSASHQFWACSDIGQLLAPLLSRCARAFRAPQPRALAGNCLTRWHSRCAGLMQGCLPSSRMRTRIKLGNGKRVCLHTLFFELARAQCHALLCSFFSISGQPRGDQWSLMLIGDEGSISKGYALFWKRKRNTAKRKRTVEERRKREKKPAKWRGISCLNYPC